MTFWVPIRQSERTHVAHRDLCDLGLLNMVENWGLCWVISQINQLKSHFPFQDRPAVFPGWRFNPRSNQVTEPDGFDIFSHLYHLFSYWKMTFWFLSLLPSCFFLLNIGYRNIKSHQIFANSQIKHVSSLFKEPAVMTMMIYLVQKK